MEALWLGSVFNDNITKHDPPPVRGTSCLGKSERVDLFLCLCVMVVSL